MWMYVIPLNDILKKMVKGVTVTYSVPAVAVRDSSLHGLGTVDSEKRLSPHSGYMNWPG